MDWWNELTGLQRIFVYIATPATLVMIIQFILFLFGLGHDHGADGIDGADMDDGLSSSVLDGETSDILEGHSHDIPDSSPDDGMPDSHDAAHENVDALRLFTLRSIIAFFAIGGWMGAAALSWKLPVPVAVILAIGAGWLALYFVAWSIRTALRLQQSGNINIKNAVGAQGEVYIPIPASRKGFGKVNVIVQERLCEFDAVTDSDQKLKTGEKVNVVGVESEGVLLVAPMNPPEGSISKINN